MSLFRGDASEIYELAGDMSQVGARAIPALRATMGQAGEALAKEWAANARETHAPGSTAGEYPNSIDSELVFDLGGVSVDVGPNAAKKHGFLGRVLETGAEHSPPYLHGLRALDGFQQRAEKMVDSAIGALFG